eukprot:3933171-Rhodomonas_salina.1
MGAFCAELVVLAVRDAVRGADGGAAFSAVQVPSQRGMRVGLRYQLRVVRRKPWFVGVEWRVSK